MKRSTHLRNIAFALAHTFKLRGNDFCIIENERITRLQQIRQLEYQSIFEWLTGTHTQKFGVIARLGWTQSNALFRQIEIEKINTHHKPHQSTSVGMSRPEMHQSKSGPGKTGAAVFL